MIPKLFPRLVLPSANRDLTGILHRKVIPVVLAGFFLICSSLCSVAQKKEPARPPVLQIDHIMIRVDDPSKFYAFFTDTLALPVAWPLATRGGVTSGGASFGNANIEAIQFPEQKTTQAVLVGFGFEPSPLAECLAELDRRGIEYGEPRPIIVTQQDGLKNTLFTNVTLRQFSDADRPANATIHIFLSEYSPTYVDVEQRRKRLAKELRESRGGPLGVMAIKEVIIGARDLKAAEKLWGKLLEPGRMSEEGLWHVGDGPTIRLVEAEENKLQGLVISVASLGQAEDFLRKRDLLGSVTKKDVCIDSSKIQGLNIRLVEDR